MQTQPEIENDEGDREDRCQRCDGTGDMTIYERAVGINAGIGIPDGQWFSWKDTCKDCGGTGKA